MNIKGGAMTLYGQLEGSSTAPRPAIEPCLPPPRRRTGAALVIFPGGGYAGLSDYEGMGYARWFARRGICCFVVTYRLGAQGFRHPAMLEDALAAIATVRAQAPSLGVDPRRIGVMGSSAGGHLTAHAMVAFGRYEREVPLRPDFGVLCYPVISMRDGICHLGSREMLLGPEASQQLKDETSCELHVGPETPPCFLWHTREDEMVPYANSTVFAEALHTHGVAFEMHIFDRGPHGMGYDLAHPWAELCARWIGSLTDRSADPGSRASPSS
jgi:acetyl esterase/lipase